MRVSGRRPIRWLYAMALFLLVLLLVPAVSLAESDRFDGETQRAYTIVTRYQLPSRDEASNFAGVWLAGFGREEAASPTALAVTFTQQQSGWFPMWGIQLASDASLLPHDAQDSMGTGPLSGLRFVSLWTTSTPRWGHTYETWLSYEPHSGTVSVYVEDVTDSYTVFKGSFTVPTYDGPLFPAAGMSSSGSVFVPLADLRVEPYFIPRAVEWELRYPDASGRSVSLTRFMEPIDRQNTTSALRLVVPGSGDGTLRIFQQHGLERQPILIVDRPHGDQLHPIRFDTWVAGESLLVLEYERDGELLFTEHRPVVTGKVFLEFDRTAHLVEKDGSYYIETVASVRTDGAIPPLDVKVSYEIATPTLTSPLHDTWRTATGSVTFRVEAERATTIDYPVSIPVPSHLYISDRYETFVTLAPTADSDIPVVFEPVVWYALGTRHPVFPKVGPYEVLRADLHTHTLASDGHLTPEERVWETYKYGYDVLALTDHRTTRAYDASIGLADRLGITLIPGFETGLHMREHLVVLDVGPEYDFRDEHDWALTPGGSRVFYQDQVRSIVENGGWIFYAHPGWPETNDQYPDADAGWTQPIEWMIRNNYLGGVEIRGDCGRRCDVPFRWALEYDLAVVDVTDVHEARDFNNVYGSPMTLILSESRSREDVMDALREGRTFAYRSGQLRGKEEWLAPFLKALVAVTLVTEGNESYVLLRQNGPLTLHGAVTFEGSADERRVFLSPWATARVPWDGASKSVRIRWNSVLKGPGDPLEMEYVLEGQ